MVTVVAASTIRVTSPDSLEEALSQARPGDTILLAPGSYGDMRIEPSHLAEGGHGFDAPVTITSQDPDDPAVFTDLELAGVANLSIDGLAFEHTPQAGERVNDPVLNIRSVGDLQAENITVTNSLFTGQPAAAGVGGDPSDPADVSDHGGLVAGMYSGLAVKVSDAANIVIENNEITGFFRGVSVEDVSDVSISQNYIHDLRSDGVTVGEVQNILIEENVIRDLLPWRHEDADGRGDHPDMIQFWTTNSETASEGIVIRDNALLQTETDGSFFAQGIFMRNPKAERDAESTEFFYRDVTIEGNLIYNSHINSLVVGEATGVTIADNTLIQNTDAGVRALTTPIIAVAERSIDVTVSGNTVPDLSRDYSTISNMATLEEGAERGWTVAQNVFTHLQQGLDGQEAVGPDGIVVDYEAFVSTLDALGELVRSPEGMSGALSLIGGAELIEHDDGRIDLQYFNETDGVLRETIEVDLAGTERWESRANRFDAEGERSEREITWDNGLFDTQAFEAGNMVRRTIEDREDIADWQTFLRVFDDSDTLRFATWHMDDGSERTQVRDADGNLESERFIDHTDVAAYTEKLTTYAVDGSFTEQRWMDTGEVLADHYDPDGLLQNSEVVGWLDVA